MTVWIVGVSLIQLLFALIYACLLYRSNRTIAKGFQPKAAVVLALRGSDPFLVQNISALTQQDYPDFTLFIVVDSPRDSAWMDVSKAQSLAPGRIVTMTLEEPLQSCSLKCSALAEAIERIDTSFEVIAFLDGDACPHRTWLRELIQPLADAKIGVTTGNRWYIPSHISCGAMVRYFWNAGAIVQVWLNDIVWGGSMALRREVIDQIGLVSRLRKSFVDDGAVVRQVQRAGLKTRFVPTVIMPNREDISVRRFISWSERQLLAARSADSGWAIILLHACSIAFCVLAPIAMLILGMMAQEPRVALLAIVSLVAYWIGAALSTIAIETGMQAVLRRNHVSAKWINARASFYYFPTLVLSHFAYFRAIVGATIRTRVAWRGIEYEILGVSDIRMVEYQPYVAQSSQQDVSSII